MGNLIRQSLKPNKISSIKLIIMSVCILIVMKFLLNITIQFGAVISSILAVLSIAIGSLFCFILIYKNLSTFEYKLIDNELILERALGKANHVVYTIKKDQLLEIVPYHDYHQDRKIARLNHLVINNDKSKWYVISFMNKYKKSQLVIEPDEHFLSGILALNH